MEHPPESITSPSCHGASSWPKVTQGRSEAASEMKCHYSCPSGRFFIQALSKDAIIRTFCLLTAVIALSCRLCIAYTYWHTLEVWPVLMKRHLAESINTDVFLIYYLLLFVVPSVLCSTWLISLFSFVSICSSKIFWRVCLNLSLWHIKLIKLRWCTVQDLFRKFSAVLQSWRRQVKPSDFAFNSQRSVPDIGGCLENWW